MRPDKHNCELAITHAVTDFYKDRLVSCAVFGSVARNTATPQSDTDLFLIINELPHGRMARIREFISIEEHVVKDLGYDPVLSPVIKTPDEVLRGSPLLWDMIDYADILYDEDDFLHNLLQKTKEHLIELGAHRVQKGNAWYWILKDDFTPGEVFQI